MTWRQAIHESYLRRQLGHARAGQVEARHQAVSAQVEIKSKI